MNSELTFKQGLRDTLPTVFGYIGIGLAFGMIGHAANFSVLIVFLLSLIVYAGSAQFIMITLLADKSPILSIILSVFLVNSRMILMSMTTASYFKKESLLKNIFLGTLLTDESFALGMNKQNYTGGKLSFPWFNAANLLSYMVWNVATVVGALLGNLLTDPRKLGLGFAVIAMFIGLLYLQLISDKSLGKLLQLIMIGITFVLFYFGLMIIPSNLLVLFVTLIACAVGVGVKRVFF
ncbi:MAG: AzlC family ABC transporter permease [Streptococcaceae bacterium]|nr:AzlC family ABC transporter permease [Streptococcaceae bacterium]